MLHTFSKAIIEPKELPMGEYKNLTQIHSPVINHNKVLFWFVARVWRNSGSFDLFETKHSFVGMGGEHEKLAMRFERYDQAARFANEMINVSKWARDCDFMVVPCYKISPWVTIDSIPLGGFFKLKENSQERYMVIDKTKIHRAVLSSSIFTYYVDGSGTINSKRNKDLVLPITERSF